MTIVHDKILGTLTLKGMVNNKELSVTAMQDGCEDGKIVIRFDRYEHSNTDIITMLLDFCVRGVLKKERIIGDYAPLRMTEAERLAIYDFKHDEVVENQNPKLKTKKV